MKVGYIRVSTEEQNTARQEVLMEQLGVEKIYIEKMSGKSKSSFLQKSGKTVTNLSRKMYSFCKENENDSRCHSWYI